MKCFYHPQLDAVGICKNCGRALCPESITEMEDGLACKGRCEARVQALIATIRRSQRVVSGYRRGIVFLFVLGALFVLWGILFTMQGETIGLFLVSAGIVFCGLGAFTYWGVIRSRASREAE